MVQITYLIYQVLTINDSTKVKAFLLKKLTHIGSLKRIPITTNNR